MFTYIVCGFVGDTITVDKYVDNIKRFFVNIKTRASSVGISY